MTQSAPPLPLGADPGSRRWPFARRVAQGASLGRSTRGRGRQSLILVFLVLPFTVYLTLVVYPFIQSAWYSMTSWSGFSQDQPFIGLANYAALASDDRFRLAVGNSLMLLVIVPIFTLGLAYALACVVTFGGRSVGTVQGIAGSRFYSTVSFFPYVIPAIVIALMWNQIYDPGAGLLNGLLRAVGLDGLQQVWLGDPGTAMPASIVVMVWALIGFYTVLFVAALRGLPLEIFEAARLDGAGRVRMALSIALPNILTPARGAYVYMGIAALDAFLPMALLNPTGGPDFSTLVITQDIYLTAFREGKFGLACAMGVVLAALTFGFAGLLALAAKLTERWTP